MTNIKLLIDKCNQEEIYYPSEKYDQKNYEKNNQTAGLNVQYAKKEKIYPVYESKDNSNC